MRETVLKAEAIRKEKRKGNRVQEKVNHLMN